MTDEQQALFAKAHRMLKTARLSLEDGDAESAINRAYYAAFHAATTALLAVGETPKTHSRSHHRFYRHYVKKGPLKKDIGRTLSFAYELRQRADYEAFTVFDEAASADLITDVEAFVRAVEEMLDAAG